MKLSHTAAAICGLAGLASGAMAQDTNDWATSRSYDCERGAQIDVIYINTPTGESYAVADLDGRLRAFEIGVSGSGARYEDGTEGGYVLHNKGEMVSVFHGADETPLLTECSEAR